MNENSFSTADTTSSGNIYADPGANTMTWGAQQVPGTTLYPYWVQLPKYPEEPQIITINASTSSLPATDISDYYHMYCNLLKSYGELLEENRTLRQHVQELTANILDKQQIASGW